MSTEVAVETVEEIPVRPAKDWYSGWCNGGAPVVGTGCTDGVRTNKVGEPIRSCRYIAENGEKVPLRNLYCACACHDGERVADDPAYKGDVV